jgi:hypothetical protein
VAHRHGHEAHTLDSTHLEHVTMTLHLTIGPLIALIAGILILVRPRLLNYIVAIYLIVVGVLGLLGVHGQRIF